MAKQRKSTADAVEPPRTSSGAGCLLVVHNAMWALTHTSDATELAGWQQLTLSAGERVSVVGCALTRCVSGCAWTHGHRLVSGSDSLLLRSLPDVGSTTVLEGGPAGAVLSLRALDVPASGAAAAEPGAAHVRVIPYGDAVAAGHATLVTQASARQAASVDVLC